MCRVRRARCCYWALAALLLTAGPASAKSYSADRFDSVVRVLPDGTLEVTETVVFRFEEGTFREVFREIPERLTDGIDVLSAEMNGAVLPAGTEMGTAEIRRRRHRVRVVWRFSPVEGITRTFGLRYRVRGAVRETDGGDLLLWRAIPSQHQYRIGSSTITYELPSLPSDGPDVRTRRTSAPEIDVAGNTVRVQASNIRSNGWVETSIAFPRGTVLASAPAWQQRARRVQAQSPSWIMAAALIAAAGFVLLLTWRQGYDRPARETFRVGSPQDVPPDTLEPAIAGVLARNGRPAIEHAMAALFSLAERGEIEIVEKPRSLGQRSFELTRQRGSGRLAEYERATLHTIFKGDPPAGASVPLAKARSRLTARPSRFRRAVEQELQMAGLLDSPRKALRDRYRKAGLSLLAAGAAGFIPAALFVEDHGPWPLLLPVAVIGIALAAFILGATITPLSNEGVRRAARWRDYRKHLRAIADGKQSAAAMSPPSALPFAVALGLAGAWAGLLKQGRYDVPAWFHAMRDGDHYTAFPAFIAAGGSGASSSHGGGGGGAAGGGASGAH